MIQVKLNKQAGSFEILPTQSCKLQYSIYTHYTYARKSEAEISPLEIFKTRNLQQKL